MLSCTRCQTQEIFWTHIQSGTPSIKFCGQSFYSDVGIYILQKLLRVSLEKYIFKKKLKTEQYIIEYIYQLECFNLKFKIY